jgi:cell division protein FtsW
MMKLARTDRSAWTELMFTVDKGIFLCVFLLMAAGLLVGLVASPAVAERLHLEPMHFFIRQFTFILVAVPMVLGIALLDTNTIRRLGFVIFALSLVGLVILPIIGMDIKGANRWISIGSFSLQPSEFLKPGFVIVLAAIFASVTETNRKQISLIAAVVTGIVVLFLIGQPDYGQTSLVAASFVIMLLLSGAPRRWIATFGAIGAGFSVLAYITVDHVRSRVDTWLNPGSGDTYQIDLSLDAIARGGVTGQGLGEGRVKHVLPDAHTDFIFAATAEEFGIFACLALMSLFSVIVWRGLKRSMETIDPFTQLATAGLVSLFGLQAIINIGVNMKVLPTKGMTLPLVSYGGSSLLALAITTGMILALTRKRAGSRGTSLRPLARNAR